MKRLNKVFSVKVTALFLILLMTHGNLMIFSQENRLDKLFQWAKMDFNSEKYRDVASDLELMLSYYDKGSTESSNSAGLKLKGKIHLLLGACFEKLGRIPDARENYRLAKLLLDKSEYELEDVILDDFPEYQKMILGTESNTAPTENIIQHPMTKPQKKKHSLLPLVIGGAIVAGVLAAVLLMKKKSDSKSEQNFFYDTNVLKIEWVIVPAGEYALGDTFNEGEADELPVHNAFMNSFNMSKYEITFEQYDIFYNDSNRSIAQPNDNGWGRGNRPVINVTWKDAYDFCRWLSEKTGKNIHLPTEAQWEVAAKTSAMNRYPWGNTPPDCDKVNYNCGSMTHVVGSHPEGVTSNKIFDLAGNVSEWCWDAYHPSYYQIAPDANPFNSPPTVSYMAVDYVIRGGSWNFQDPSGIRCTDRSYGRYYWGGGTTAHVEDTKNTYVGFRIVRD